MTPEVIKNKYGYYELANKPTEAELKEYYQEKYYQQNQGAYQKSYNDDERTFLASRVNRKLEIIKEETNLQGPGRVLDVGCGEGWTLNFFDKEGWEVSGLEYSDFGLMQFNAHLRDALTAGDVWSNLGQLIADGKQYDVVILDNVLEHVIDPSRMIAQLQHILAPQGILIIEVPNDFSRLQALLLDEGQIDRQFWVTAPDHISYFNKEGLTNLAAAKGWDLARFSTDYPIDLNLLNPDSNYVMDKTKGRNVHLARVAFENLLDELPTKDVNTFYEALAQLGLGRNLTAFFKKSLS